MSSVTGMGCLLSSVAAALLAASPEEPMTATTEALRIYAICGEKAAEISQGPGSFQFAFLDELASMKQGIDNEPIRLEEDVLWKL